MSDDFVGRHVGRAVYRSCQEMIKLNPLMPEPKVADRVLAWAVRSLALNCVRSLGEARARDIFDSSLATALAVMEDQADSVRVVKFQSPPK